MADLSFTTPTASGIPAQDFLFTSEAYTAPETSFDFVDGEYTPSYEFEFDPLTNRANYSVLRLASNNVTSIWADDNASRTNNKMYLATNNELDIVNLTTNIVVDHYSQTHGGHAEEPLNSDDIVDINVTG